MEQVSTVHGSIGRGHHASSVWAQRRLREEKLIGEVGLAAANAKDLYILISLSSGMSLRLIEKKSRTSLAKLSAWLPIPFSSIKNVVPSFVLPKLRTALTSV